MCQPEGYIYINTCGNDGMATAGSGDVLTGIIAALLGQGVSLADAAVYGAFIHGRAGDKASLITGRYGLSASHIIEGIRSVFKESVEI